MLLNLHFSAQGYILRVMQVLQSFHVFVHSSLSLMQKSGLFLFFFFVLRITGLIHKRHRSPWLWNDVLYSWTPSGREHDECLQIIHGFTNKVSHSFFRSPTAPFSYNGFFVLYCFFFLLLVLFTSPPLSNLLFVPSSLVVNFMVAPTGLKKRLDRSFY